MKFTATQIDRIQAQVALLVATNNRSPAARQTLAYLQSLIAVARPAKTQLLANYPNPFNPETWIPYRLAAAADVTLTLYDINGQVVRDVGTRTSGLRVCIKVGAVRRIGMGEMRSVNLSPVVCISIL